MRLLRREDNPPTSQTRRGCLHHDVGFSLGESLDPVSSFDLLIATDRPSASMRLSFWLLLAPLATAWVVPTPSRTSTRLYSAVEEKVLAPEFQAAYQMAKDKVEASIPEEMKTAYLPLLTHFMEEYLKASQDAFLDGNEHCDPASAAKRFLTGIAYGQQFGMGPNKVKFDVTNTAMRGNPETENGNTIDFYEFGCAFFRSVMDLKQSVVLGEENIAKINAQLDAGENVVLFANHQSEADPQVVSCCMELVEQPRLAEDMVYVAGHKVTTDPLAIPFSMGRNLLCIHSKKHIDADPDLKPMRQKQNLKAMSQLLNKFKAGGAIVWIAPSGGRDRRDLSTGKVPIAPFDSKTIDMFRLMGNKSKVPTHYYTLAMVSYDLCPPPDFVDPGVGEQRNVRYVPVGIAVGKEVESVGGLEARHDFCDHAMAQCQADYEQLLERLS